MGNRWFKGAIALLFGAVLAMPGFAGEQKKFSSPEAAAEALVDSLARNDDVELRAVLGPKQPALIPLDDISTEDRNAFLAAWAKGHRIVRTDDTKALLELENGWRLPVPIVRTKAGWAFDVQAGREEMRTRRIGRNELAAIQSLLAFVAAQNEYAAEDRNADGVVDFAQKILSSPGARDGLYWPVAEGEQQSPLGPLFDTAKLKDGYHGYHFRILKAQGSAAPGGARDYVKGGRMTDGFALVAWPARYGETGIMTFIVSQDGVVYEKHLGPNSAAIASAMTRFDPDPSWRALSAP